MAKRRRKQRPPAAPPESQASVFVTVGWSLSVITTLACASIALAVWLVVRDRADNETPLLFVRLMHFSSIVTGFFSLFLLPVVLKVRPEPPPASLVALAAAIAALPILAALL